MSARRVNQTVHENGYGYIVEAVQIERMFNRYGYSARVTQLFRDGGPGLLPVFLDFSHFNQHLGETVDEAFGRAMAEVSAWIRRQ